MLTSDGRITILRECIVSKVDGLNAACNRTKVILWIGRFG